MCGDDHMKAELNRLSKENKALKKGASECIRMKISEKRAVSIYGMGRFPVTLYKEQWLKLLDLSDEIRAFIATNEARLKTKEQLQHSLWQRAVDEKEIRTKTEPLKSICQTVGRA